MCVLTHRLTVEIRTSKSLAFWHCCVCVCAPCCLLHTASQAFWLNLMHILTSGKVLSYIRHVTPTSHIWPSDLFYQWTGSIYMSPEWCARSAQKLDGKEKKLQLVKWVVMLSYYIHFMSPLGRPILFITLKWAHQDYGIDFLPHIIGNFTKAHWLYIEIG